jgi:hypothetical protein
VPDAPTIFVSESEDVEPARTAVVPDSVDKCAKWFLARGGPGPAQPWAPRPEGGS